MCWTKRAKFLFLVGSPRSGTTWLQALIASHPCVATGPETHFFEAVYDLVEFYEKSRPRPDGLREYLSQEEFYQEIKNFFYKITSKVSPPEHEPFWFLEKTPQHALFVDLIIRLFPDAYFIHLIRDPRNVVASILRASHSWGHGWFPDSAMIAAQLWKRCVEESKKIPHKIEDPAKFLEIRYEDLKRDAVQELSKIFSWLGLDYEYEFLEDIVEKNTLKKVKVAGQFFSVDFPRKKEHVSEPQGFFSSGGDCKKNLSILQKFQVEIVCSDLLVELGYEKDPPKVPLWARIFCSWRLRKLFGLKPI